MASNQKLTRVIAGRAIKASAQADDVLTLTFDDGSKMTIKTAPRATNSAVNTGAKAKKVRQKGSKSNLDLENGTTWTIHTAEATSSVMLRDAAGKMEYAD